MIDGNDEKMTFEVVSGAGNVYYPRELRKKTKV